MNVEETERGREGGTFQRKKEKSEYTVQPRGKRGKESFLLSEIVWYIGSPLTYVLMTLFGHMSYTKEKNDLIKMVMKLL